MCPFDPPPKEINPPKEILADSSFETELFSIEWNPCLNGGGSILFWCTLLPCGVHGRLCDTTDLSMSLCHDRPQCLSVASLYSVIAADCINNLDTWIPMHVTMHETLEFFARLMADTSVRRPLFTDVSIYVHQLNQLNSP